jgi:hypothetical protein
MKKLLLFSLTMLLLGGILAPPARGQDIGNVGFRTVNQKIFVNQTTATTSPASSAFPCTPTNGSPCVIPNLGQNIHSVTYQIQTPCATGFFMDLRLEATQDGITWFPISNDATDQNSGNIQGATSLGLTAIGLYAGYRLNLVSLSCDSGQNTGITATYSGTFSSNPSANGVFYQSSPVRQLLLQNFPTTGTFPTSITVPAVSGSTAGMLYVQCSVVASGASSACPASNVQVTSYIAFGSSIGGGGGGNPNTSSLSYSIPLTNGALINLQSYPASSITFGFTSAGTAGINMSAYYFPTPAPPSPFVADPCASPGAAKSSVNFLAAAAGTTSVIPVPANGTAITYVCFYQMGQNATVGSYQWTSGTGAACGTNTVIKSGVIPVANSQPITAGPGATLFSVAAGSGVCLTTTGAGGTIGGIINYVQQ